MPGGPGRRCNPTVKGGCSTSKEPASKRNSRIYPNFDPAERHALSPACRSGCKGSLKSLAEAGLAAAPDRQPSWSVFFMNSPTIRLYPLSVLDFMMDRAVVDQPALGTPNSEGPAQRVTSEDRIDTSPGHRCDASRRVERHTQRRKAAVGSGNNAPRATKKPGNVVRPPGLEPGTRGLKVRCSAN